MKYFHFHLVCISFILRVAYSISGEIITCPACRLNGLPEVRTFIKQPGHADAYENLKITYIRGRNPDLFIRDDSGALLEKIDLADYTTKGLHELMLTKGFSRKIVGVSATDSKTLRINSVSTV